MKSNKNKNKKNSVLKLKKTKKKKNILTDTEILDRLKRWIPKIVKNTTSRYATGNLASIFNEADMFALAEDTALEVLRRVKIGQEDRNLKDSVDLKGCESYFKTAFKNQCLKIYEKYAKTDIRAGVQTVGSEEALAVAASKNLYSPEDSYLLNNQFGLVLKRLKESDQKYNNMVKLSAERNHRLVEENELQCFESIFNKLLEGYTAEETEAILKLSNSEFLRQKRMMFEFIKQEFPHLLSDMLEHFEIQEDYRVHVRDVNKRQKLKQASKDFKPKSLFYIHTTIKEKNKFVATLYASIDIYDRFDNKVSKIPSKLIKVKEEVGSDIEKEMSKIKEKLWSESKDQEVSIFLQKERESYLIEVKNKASAS